MLMQDKRNPRLIGYAIGLVAVVVAILYKFLIK